MQELSPEEFQNMLDENGDLSSKHISKEDKDKILLTLMMQHAHCDSRMRCLFCKGSRFYPVGGNFVCPYCNGLGYR